MEPRGILIHVCCGVCGAYVAEKLQSQYDRLVLFFFNPNIYPPEEYLRRLAVARQLAGIYQLPLMEGEYRPKEWETAVRGHEAEREGGARCAICFRLRLEQAAAAAKTHGCEIFTTTLTMGRQKRAEVVNRIGRDVARLQGVKFLEENFKKQDGIEKTLAIAQRHNFYRQRYCGCRYSLAAANSVASRQRPQ
ncbi:MAG: epoxyqueuosine reductase QueH [Patescibacteria group bacterium]|nr:epoxyqueuosine reductase QueH [Patescibacteria group bacterium]